MVSKTEQLHSRAAALHAKFEHGGGSNYIDEAIGLDRKALECCPPSHPKRPISLTWLAIHLGDRYNRLGEMRDLEEAIVFDRDALSHCPPRHPDQSMYLNNLAVHLSARYDELGEMEDLDEAIILGRHSLALRPPGHEDRPMSLSNLAVRLSARYDQLGSMEDLDEAITLSREALVLRPLGHPDRSMSFNNLAIRLSTRFNQLGTMEDLNEAIVLGRDALILRPPGHPLRSKSLNNLAIFLSTRYDQLGAVKDLNEAIVLCRETLLLPPPTPSDRTASLSNLAAHLSTRYDQLGAVEDLNEAIVLGRNALAFHPTGHPLRSGSLHNLAIYLSTRYTQLGEMEDLNEAIALNHDALALCPPGHPGRWMSLHNLALDLSSRYNGLGAVKDLEKAIIFSHDALALCPLGHPDRSRSLNTFAGCLAIRYDRLEKMGDLDEAIIFARDALTLCPEGHPYRSTSLGNLTRCLRTRFARTNQDQDKNELFGLYSKLAHVSEMVSFNDLSVARSWAHVADNFRHPTTVLAYETSLRLLTHYLATLPSLPQHLTVFKSLTSSLAADAFSACLRNYSPTNAVELLEQGRGVFWSQLTRLHSPLDDVITSGQEGRALADEFTRSALLIRKALDSPGADQHDRVCNLNVELQKVVTRIRELPGLSRFLLPSLFSDLQQAACEGPVIIVNASEYSCDALVVLLDQDPIHVSLSITKEGVRALASKFSTLIKNAKLVNVTKELYICLRELWDEVVSPIVNFLQTIYPPQSRIWWCPTAEFCLLPLHAAGPFRKGQRNLTNLYVSSYTPTLTALIRARRHDPSHSVIERRHFVAIGQAMAVGQSVLPSVAIELANVGQRVEGFTVFTRVEGEDSCISRVAEELGRNEWVHLACHGIPNPQQPFESAFALFDGPFTIEHIIRCEMKNPQFAYLSACHTTVGDEDSPDEVIHLAAAMQFAGFRSVIGTMWGVDDSETKKITSMFYDNMIDGSGRLDHSRAAFALNKTMKALVNLPFDQRILYMHIGA